MSKVEPPARTRTIQLGGVVGDESWSMTGEYGRNPIGEMVCRWHCPNCDRFGGWFYMMLGMNETHTGALTRKARDHAVRCKGRQS